jgi:hypothetical protein
MQRIAKMSDWIVPLLVVAAYVILQRWVLPAMGVPT